MAQMSISEGEAAINKALALAQATVFVMGTGDFDEESAAGQAADLPMLNSPYTITAMVKPSRGTLCVCQWGATDRNKFNSIFIDNGCLKHPWWANDLETRGDEVDTLYDEEWHCIAASWDGKTRRQYVDGVEVDSDEPGDHDVTTKANFKLGVFTGFGSPMCHMKRDELKAFTIFDVCLENGGGVTGEGITQAELKDIMKRNSGILSSDKQLLASVLVTSIETKTAGVALELLSLYGEADEALVGEIHSKLIPDGTVKGSLLMKFLTVPSDDSQSEELLDALLALDPKLKEAALSSETLPHLIKAKKVDPAVRLLSKGATITEEVREGLLSGEGKEEKTLLTKLILDNKCAALVSSLCDADPTVKEAALSGEMLIATLTPKTASVALELLSQGAVITDEVRSALIEGVAGGGGGGEPTLEEVAEDPASYILVLSGHNDHPQSNGAYHHEGEENGKPKWAKDGTQEKIYWTGGSWDVFWGGYSPEAPVNSAVPPLDGYIKDKGSCDIKVEYQRVDGGGGGGGSIEFLGLWTDSGDRAMPIKMNVNAGNDKQVQEAFAKLLAEMEEAGSTSGLIAAQSYNQMHWTTDSDDEGYKRHGLIGSEASDVTKSTWSGRIHTDEGITIDGFRGTIDILGGDWQNAVYRVTIGGVSPPLLDKLVLDNTCAALVAHLSEADPAIKAAVLGEDKLIAALSPKTHAVSEALLAQGAEVSDTVAKMLLTPDDKGKSPIELLVADPACNGLVDTLCSHESVGAAVVSPAMFGTMAKPATAAAALRLVEEKGLSIDEAMVTTLLTGTGVEYHLNDKQMNWQKHEDAAVEWGGHLTSITSMEEHEHVREMASGCKDGGRCWLGGKRNEPHKGNGPGPEHWSWVDGTPWDFEFWGPGEPNNRGDREDRVHMLEWFGAEMKWNDCPGDWNEGGVGVYKRGGRPLDMLVLSKDPSTVKLVQILAAQFPELIVAASIVTMSTPKTSKAALELLEQHPKTNLDDDALVEPLIAKGADKLRKLAEGGDDDCATLIGALYEKSKAVAAVVAAPEFVIAMLRPKTQATAHLLITKFNLLTASVIEALLALDDKGKAPLERLVADPSCNELVDVLCASDPSLNSAVVSPAMFGIMAKPSTAAAALRLVEEKGLEIDESLALALTTGRAPSMDRIEVGHGISRTSTQAMCEERGGRLAYRCELYDTDTKTLLVNDGKAFGGDKWIPVLDGDPKHNNSGVGWVQVGDQNRLGKNHKEAHHGDCGWGEASDRGGHKGPWCWCVIEGAPIVPLALAKDEASIKLLGLVTAKQPDLVLSGTVVARCSPKTAASAIELLNEHPSMSIEGAVSPLFADNNKALIKLAKSDDTNSRALIDALRLRSKAVAGALNSKEMLSSMLTPSSARALVRYLEAAGPEALISTATEIGEADYVIVPKAN